MKLARDEMTDTQKFWVDVSKTGEEGAHSHDLSRSIPSLNVSQRAKDCASKGQEVFTATERRNGRPGSRFWIGAHNAPDYAVPVRPNLTGGSLLPDPVNPESDASGTPPTPARPDSAGAVGGDLLEPVALVRDYDGEWYERPVSQIPGLERWAA